MVAGGSLWAACGHTSRPADTTKQDSSSAANPFFPVATYLESEILYVDSTPTALWKYVTHGRRTDTSFIGVPEFNGLALQFLPPEIRDSGWQRHFTESSFSDRSTRSITFSYSPLASTSGVQRVDVVTTPGERAQKVKSVYIEKSRGSGDSLIIQKMLWRSGIGFQIVTLTSVKGKDADQQQVKVVWGREDDDDDE